MAEAKDSLSKGSGGGPEGAPGRAPPLKHLWPIPALGLAAAMLVGGLVVAVMHRPKPDPSQPLVRARALVEEQKFDEALGLLNKDARALVDSGAATGKQVGEFHLLLARALWGGQVGLGVSVAANHRNIVDEYQRAEKAGEELGPADVQRLIESLIALDKVAEATGRIERLPAADSARRIKMTRGVIEHNLAGEDRREAQTLDMLAKLGSEPDLTAADRAWVLARQAELLIATGQPEEAVNRIVRRIALLKDVPGEQQGELYVLLGRAYFQADQPTGAVKQLEAADGLLDKGSPLRADMAVMLGRLDQGAGNLDQAKERFEGVVKEYSTSRAYPRAVLGLAEIEAAEQRDGESAERYAEAAEIASKGGAARGELTRELVLASLSRRWRERLEKGERESALRFAQLAESMYRDSETPPELLLAIGQTHRAMSEAAMAMAREGRGEEFTVEEMDAATRAEVKRHSMGAGEYLKRHAQAVLASDPAAYGTSLWMAADSYDRAGDLDEAQKAFAQYAEGASDNDAKKPEARYRLAQIFQARRELAAAAALYRQLVNSRTPGPGASQGAGVWADRAVVPLAQCLLEDGESGNDAEAERLLSQVVDGTTMAPEASAYRDALIELGTMCYQTGRYAEAVGWLDQASKRYEGDRRIDAVRYRLADSHRLEALKIAKMLEQKMPHSQAEELEQARMQHLKTGRATFEGVQASLEARPSRKLSEMERVYLRNAMFYAGDCALELKDYDGAIAAYDAARLKYADDPASLVAMVQIVSAYVAQGQWAQARTANERARQQLGRFPESVWTRSDLPMEKRHWERWLDARTALDQAASGQDTKE